MRFFCLKQPVFRLRVVANSDSETDQRTKLRVRDAVLPVALERPFSLSRVQKAARAVDPTARARRGTLRFGGYASDAVQVTLGSGRGHNWWGIVYPEAAGLPAGTVHFEFWLVALLRRWGWLS